MVFDVVPIDDLTYKVVCEEGYDLKTLELDQSRTCKKSSWNEGFSEYFVYSVDDCLEKDYSKWIPSCCWKFLKDIEDMDIETTQILI